MSDNLAINFQTGNYAFVSGNNVPAWHEKGILLNGPLTSEECVKHGGLDFPVSTKPCFVEIEGSQIAVPKTFATYRTDNNEILGTVGHKYKVVQNRDAFKFFDAIVGSGEAIYETAGALGRGERIFISAKMPNYVTINGTNDVTEFYVLLTSSHDGTGAIKALVTPVRVVCANTLRMALKSTVNQVSIRHTANAETALQDAHRVLGITNNFVKEMDELLNFTTQIKVSDQKAKEVIAQLFPSQAEEDGKGINKRTENKRDAMFEAYMTGIGQQGIIGTGYGLLQGVTYYTSHVREFRDNDNKLEYLLEGTGFDLVTQAKDLILAI